MRPAHTDTNSVSEITHEETERTNQPNPLHWDFFHVFAFAHCIKVVFAIQPICNVCLENLSLPFSFSPIFIFSRENSTHLSLRNVRRFTFCIRWHANVYKQSDIAQRKRENIDFTPKLLEKRTCTRIYVPKKSACVCFSSSSAFSLACVSLFSFFGLDVPTCTKFLWDSNDPYLGIVNRTFKPSSGQINIFIYIWPYENEAKLQAFFPVVLCFHLTNCRMRNICFDSHFIIFCGNA